MTSSQEDGGEETDVSGAKRQSNSIDRYDLAGHNHRKWTEQARELLVATLRKLLEGGKAVAYSPMPGTSDSLSDVASRSPGKVLGHVEARLDQPGIDNRLKMQQVETEFYRTELVRNEARKAAAEAESVELDNLRRRIEIIERLSEITEGKTDLTLDIVGGDPSVIAVTLPVNPALEDNL